MATHYTDMTTEHLGPDATEQDLAEFVEICEQAEELHPEIDDITEAVFGDGDYFRNARRLGVDVETILAKKPNNYEASIDSGEGGTTTIQAATVTEAMGKATEWAKGGEWKQDGTVIVRVKGPDGEDREDVEVYATDTE